MSSPTGEVLGAERKRRFTLEEKLALIAETQAAGMSVSRVARLHGISRDLLFRWRRELRERQGSNLVPVEVAEDKACARAGPRLSSPVGVTPAIIIELKSGDRVRLEGVALLPANATPVHPGLARAYDGVGQTSRPAPWNVAKEKAGRVTALRCRGPSKTASRSQRSARNIKTGS